MKSELPRIMSGAGHGTDARLAAIAATHINMKVEAVLFHLEANKIDDAKAVLGRIQHHCFTLISLLAEQHGCDAETTMQYYLDLLYPDKKE